MNPIRSYRALSTILAILTAAALCNALLSCAPDQRTPAFARGGVDAEGGRRHHSQGYDS